MWRKWGTVDIVNINYRLNWTCRTITFIIDFSLCAQVTGYSIASIYIFGKLSFVSKNQIFFAVFKTFHKDDSVISFLLWFLFLPFSLKYFFTFIFILFDFYFHFNLILTLEFFIFISFGFLFSLSIFSFTYKQSFFYFHSIKIF